MSEWVAKSKQSFWNLKLGTWAVLRTDLVDNHPEEVNVLLKSLTLLLKKLSLWLTSPNLGRLTSGKFFPLVTETRAEISVLVLQNPRWYKQQNKSYAQQQNRLKKNNFFFGYLRFFLYLCIRKRLIRQETALCKKMQIRLEENVHWHIEKSPYLCRRKQKSTN